MDIYLQNALDNVFSNIYFPETVISRERAIKTYFLADKQKPLLVNEFLCGRPTLEITGNFVSSASARFTRSESQLYHLLALWL